MPSQTEQRVEWRVMVEPWPSGNAINVTVEGELSREQAAAICAAAAMADPSLLGTGVLLTLAKAIERAMPQ